MWILIRCIAFELEFEVPAGAEFGFAVFTVDGLFNVGRLFVMDFALTPAVPGCPADLDGNGEVGHDDLAIVLGNWGACPPECPGDLDADGVVDGTDLGILLGSWGPCPVNAH